VIRWLKFSAVGAAGTGVQLLALALYLKLDMNYLLATAAAVETALLHNYVWHSHWTWRGRAGRFWRFQLSNGLVSIVSNVFIMRLLTGWAGVPPVPANLAAIAATSLMNLWLGDRWVFTQRKALFTVKRCAPLLR
jgi:putative flippase GtrA